MADLKKTRVGTSGYSFLDWIGTFYPSGIEKGKMLDYYVQHFDTVEVNSSYYRIPHPKVFENMEKKTPPEFQFFIKVHKYITHDRKDLIETLDEFRTAIEPIANADKLSGLLVQFPYSFRWSKQNKVYLMQVANLLSGYKVYVEFRNRTWIREELIDFFTGARVHLCSIDGPQIQALPVPDIFNTGNRVYVRLHGRNREQWWNGGQLRYDYLYTEAELDEWIRKIVRLKAQPEEISILFNNCHQAKAVKNAVMMKQLIERELGVTSDATK